MYCFVEYADPSMAQCALALDGLQLGSRQIKVSVARSPSNPPGSEGGGGVGHGGMSGGGGGQRGGMHAVAAAAAAAAAAYGGAGGRPGGGGGRYGMPPPHYQHGGGGGFLQHGGMGGGGGGGAGAGAGHNARGNNHDPVRVAKTIFVDGVLLTVSEETLATFFSMCGAVFAVRLTPPAPSGDMRRAWVEFENLESARLALQYDSTVMGGSTLRVSASRSQIHTNGLRETVAPPEGVPLGLPRPGEAPAAPAAAGTAGNASAAAAAAAAAAASIKVPEGRNDGKGSAAAPNGDGASPTAAAATDPEESPASKRERDNSAGCAGHGGSDADKRPRVNPDGTPVKAE